MVPPEVGPWGAVPLLVAPCVASLTDSGGGLATTFEGVLLLLLAALAKPPAPLNTAIINAV